MRPYLIEDIEAEGRILKPLPVRSKLFQEEWLQKLLQKHPAILPVEQIDECFGPLVSLGREIANIDNLFISPVGNITIVETKLWRNPEAHRTVVAQILEYAKTLAGWTYQRLNEKVEAYGATHLGAKYSIYQLVKNGRHALEIDEIEFQQKVQTSLDKGRFALLIVGDRIYPEATQLAEIIQSAPHMEFSIGFVELVCHRLGKEADWPLVVVPKLVSRTREVTRAVVKVLYEEKKPEVLVDTLEEGKVRTGSTSPEEFIASLPSDLTDVLSEYLAKWARAGYIIYWGKVGFSLRIYWQKKKTTIFEGFPEYLSIFQSKRVAEYQFPDEIFERYRSGLMSSGPISTFFTSKKRYVQYAKVSAEDIILVLECTDRLVQDLYAIENSRGKNQ